MGPIGVAYADAGTRNGCRDTVQLLEWDAAIDVHGWSSLSRAPSGRAPGQVRAPRAGPAINLNPLGPVHCLVAWDDAELGGRKACRETSRSGKEEPDVDIHKG